MAIIFYVHFRYYVAFKFVDKTFPRNCFQYLFGEKYKLSCYMSYRFLEKSI